MKRGAEKQLVKDAFDDDGNVRIPKHSKVPRR